MCSDGKSREYTAQHGLGRVRKPTLPSPCFDGFSTPLNSFQSLLLWTVCDDCIERRMCKSYNEREFTEKAPGAFWFSTFRCCDLHSILRFLHSVAAPTVPNTVSQPLLCSAYKFVSLCSPKHTFPIIWLGKI